MGWENVDEGRAREGGLGFTSRAGCCRETIFEHSSQGERCRLRIIEFHFRLAGLTRIERKNCGYVMRVT